MNNKKIPKAASTTAMLAATETTAKQTSERTAKATEKEQQKRKFNGNLWEKQAISVKTFNTAATSK